MKCFFQDMKCCSQKGKMYGHTWVCKTHSNIIHEGDNFAKILIFSKELCNQIDTDTNTNTNTNDKINKPKKPRKISKPKKYSLRLASNKNKNK